MEPKRIAVFVSGSGSNLQSLIDQEEKNKVGKIVLVFSNIGSCFGLERARKAGISTRSLRRKDFVSDQAYDKELMLILDEFRIDLIVLAGYLRIITKELVESYRNRIINIHPSLLPAFGGVGCYGIHVHDKVLSRGCRVSGATVHFVDEGADTGPIILQDALKVDPSWTSQDLQKEVLKIEHRLLPEAVRMFCEEKISIVNNKVIIRE